MKPADVAGLPIQWGASVRGARLFHPDGVLARGTVTRIAEAGVGLPIENGHVVTRVSKGVGVPGDLADVVGLAIRMDPHLGDNTPWDVLLASAMGDAKISQTIPFPVRSLHGANLSTLQPLDYDGDRWWLRARLASGTRLGSGLSLAGFRDQIDGDAMVFVLEQAWRSTAYEPLAELELVSTVSEGDYLGIGFDPTTNTTRGVRPGPGWLSKIRTVAYRQSRRGRRAP